MVSDSQFVENSHYQLTNKTVSEGVFTIFACSTDSDRDTETTQLDLSSTTSQRELSSTTTQRELSSATNQRDLSSTTTKPDWTTTTTAREEPDLPSIKVTKRFGSFKSKLKIVDVAPFDI